MERLTRLIGIGLLVGAFATSAGYYLRTLSAITSEPTERNVVLAAEPTDQQSARSAGTVDEHDPESPPPRYLTFSDGMRSGVYSVADLPTSRDRDVEPADDPRLADYPIETDIVPDWSLVERGPLAPGIYATAFGVRDCSYEIRRVNPSKVEVVIGEDRLGEGRMLVTINHIEPDVFTSMTQCGDWIQWSPLVEPLTTAGNGDYWIGDLEQGTWTVPADCIWEKVVGFRGAELADVQDSGFGPLPLVVDEETVGVRIRGCETSLTLGSPRPDPRLTPG